MSPSIDVAGKIDRYKLEVVFVFSEGRNDTDDTRALNTIFR